jgi:hypothetical protein
MRGGGSSLGRNWHLSRCYDECRKIFAGASPVNKIIQNYTFTTETSFVNDVVLTRDYAWFTDSQRPLSAQRAIHDPADFKHSVLDHPHRPPLTESGLSHAR